MSKKTPDTYQPFDDELEQLGARLADSPPAAPPLPVSARAALRQRLLSENGRPPLLSRFGAALGTAVVLVALAAAVTFFWLSLAPREAAVGPIVAARDTATPPPPTPAPTHTPAVQPTPTLPPLPSGLAAERVGDPRFGADGAVVTLYGFAAAPPQPLAGDPLTVELIWLHEGQPQTWTAFVHLLDDSGQLQAQVDAPLWVNGRFQQNQSITLPTTGLAPGAYQLVAGVYDPASGRRLPADDGSNGSPTVLFGTITLIPDGPPITADLPAGSNILRLTALSLPAGSTLTAATPITLTLDYAIDSYDNVHVTAKVVEMLPGGSFRGIADASADVARGMGKLTLLIPFTPAELSGPADLGLVLEGRTDPAGPPDVFLDMPDEVLWRYAP